MSESKKISRAQFFKTVGIGAAATIIGCSGVGYAASLPPRIEFIESNNEGANSMNKKALVAYASKAGSTAEVAEAIAGTLRKKDMQVDVRQLKNVSDLSGYDAVIVGSCIRMGKWLSAALNFVKDNQPALSRVPLAYFLVSATMRNNTPESLEKASAYLDPARAVIEPVSMGLFAGKLDFNKLSSLDRSISKMVGMVEGDWRNWEAIRAWAETILPVP